MATNLNINIEDILGLMNPLLEEIWPESVRVFRREVTHHSIASLVRYEVRLEIFIRGVNIQNILSSKVLKEDSAIVRSLTIRNTDLEFLRLLFKEIEKSYGEIPGI